MKLSRRIAAAALLMIAAVAISAVTVFALLRDRTADVSDLPLSAYAPPGALLALESPDFHALLQAWSSSPEEQRWLKSDDYAGFSRSRLFGRLKEAQDQFATSAGLSPDASFLAAVAGRQSFFAWYDIGNLEFLYITRMPPGDAAKTPLLALRDRYEERNAGGAPFYVRTEGDSHRTVAFAVRGDLLLLATREDLLANALQLLAHPGPSTLQHEPWYAAAQAAASSPADSGPPSEIRMTLNLASVVPSPYFRTYWIQKNVTELKAYSAAVSDLYRTSGEFREERILLPINSPANEPPTTRNDLTEVLRYLPSGAIYRATAHPDTDAVLTQLEDKLLTRSTGSFSDPHTLPTPDLSTPLAGSADDLEQRIDLPLVAASPRMAALAPLRKGLDAAAVSSMLVVSRFSAHIDAAGDAPGMFLPMHTAVILEGSRDWNGVELQTALAAAFAPKLSVGGLGLAWEPAQGRPDQWLHLKGFQHLALHVQGRICVLSSDDDTMQAVLASAHTASAAPMLAQIQAGADLAAARDSLSTLSRRLDHTTPQPAGTAGEPPFFAGNLLSLGDTFRGVASETFTQTRGEKGAEVHQQVVYRWSR